MKFTVTKLICLLFFCVLAESADHILFKDFVAVSGLQDGTNPLLASRHWANMWTVTKDSKTIFYLQGGHSGRVVHGDFWTCEFDRDNNHVAAKWRLLRVIPTSNYGIARQGTNETGPGPRYGSATWVDVNGDLWLLGGALCINPVACAGNVRFSDAWRYSVSQGIWHWMDGVAENRLGARYPRMDWSGGISFMKAAYSQLDNCAYLYGGQTRGFTDKGRTEHWLWRYCPLVRPHRMELISNANDLAIDLLSCFVVKGRDFYIYGGRTDSDSTSFFVRITLDPWYDPMIRIIQPKRRQSMVKGSYGVPNITNTPGSRMGASCWVNPNGFHLFGGVGVVNGVDTVLNDVWRFNLTSQIWTWIGGGDTPVFKGIGMIGSIPPQRSDHNQLVDRYGDVWIGFGRSGSRSFGDFYKMIENTCFRLPPWSDDVCSGNGACVAWNNCTCLPGSSGIQCETFSCYGVNKTDDTVCLFSSRILCQN